MKAETSFSQKVREGWTKERLMAYYALSEREYERVMECLKGISRWEYECEYPEDSSSYPLIRRSRGLYMTREYARRLHRGWSKEFLIDVFGLTEDE